MNASNGQLNFVPDLIMIFTTTKKHSLIPAKVDTCQHIQIRCMFSPLAPTSWTSETSPHIQSIVSTCFSCFLCVITSITAVNEINRDVWTQRAAKWAATSCVFHHYTQWLWIKLWEKNACKSIFACSSASSCNECIRWWMGVIHAFTFYTSC